MINYLKFIFLIQVLLTSILLNAQESKLQVKGELLLKKEKYEDIIEYMSSVDSATKVNDPLYNYYSGMAYYYSPNKKGDAAPFIASYIDQSDTNTINYYGHHHVYYVLGKTYHLLYRFDKAILNYQKYIDEIKLQSSYSNDEKNEIERKTKHEIEQCKFGQIAVNNPRNVIVENLGDSVNSIFPEYAPVVSQDEKLLIFTSRRPDTQGGKSVPHEGYMEDMYKAEMIKGSLFETKSHIPDSSKGYYFNLVTDFDYSKSQNLDNKINSKGHDGSIQLGTKDSLLYFHRDSDIWSIDMFDPTVVEPIKMGVHVNSDQHEPSLFFSYDNNKLFIVSDRPGGYGGLDIYVSKKKLDGTWSEAKNLGPNINSEYDEDAPYLDPDGKTMYFSSRGNSSIGEYDIFRSTLKDTTWGSPVNLGFPINTTSDDIYFTMTKRYNRGYYSSGRLEGKGGMDIYRITFSDERDPLAELVGFVKKGKKLIPAKSKITMNIINSDESISEETDTLKGDYFLVLGYGKTYEMTIETEGFAPYKKTFRIPEKKEYQQLYQEIHHVYLYNSDGDVIGQKITVFNAISDGDSEVTYYEKELLEKFQLLKNKFSNNFDIKALTNFEGDSLKGVMESFGSIEFKDPFDFRNLNGKQLDSLMQIMSDELGIFFDMESMQDVKFYMTKDSLSALMAVDTSLSFNFSEQVTVSFLKPDAVNKYDLTEYSDYSSSLSRNNMVHVSQTNGSGLAVATDVKGINGLFYTVQIGVYKNPVTPNVLLNISPLNSQITDKGNIRYTTGVFMDIPNASLRREELLGKIPDAYVTAYYNGKRITIAYSKELILEYGNSVLFSGDANKVLNKR